MYKVRFLFLIILIEGYVVLACELLTIRQLIPFVGSGTEIVSIIISAVLLPLAIGYHAGGNAYKRSSLKSKACARPFLSIRKILFRNTLISLVILTLGLSYVLLEFYFRKMYWFGITGRLSQTVIYSAVFLVIPIFLLGQTVPLVSNYLSKKKLSEITGRMLFFSTVGSFLGSIFSTIVLMSTIGVHNTVIVMLGLLCILGILLNRKTLCHILLLSIFLSGIILNNDLLIKSRHVVADNAYSTVQIFDYPGEKVRQFFINGSFSSLLTKDPQKRSDYMKFVEDNFIAPLSDPKGKPRDILIIGAGGFIFGLNDHINNYTYVDIDGAIKNVAEKNFLREKLSVNKQFIASSARAFVHNPGKKYDLIMLDAYTNINSIAMECITRDFLQDVKSMLKKNGVVIANVVMSADFNEKFAVRYDNTFSSVFPVHSRQILNPFNPWDNASPHWANVLYSYHDNDFIRDKSVYTDDRNTYSLDRAP